MRLVLAIIFLAAMLAATLALLSNVRAHSWYDAICCSDRDCYPLPDNAVRETVGGYSLPETGEMIPHSETRNGRDERFHICRHATGRRICFYRPYSGT